MNKDKIRLWVDALRSGQYKQTDGGLRRTVNDEKRYCCLGVACDVAIKDGLDLKVREFGGSLYDEFGEDEDGGHLPIEVQQWLGVTTASPKVVFSGEVRELAVLNDDFKLDFNEIADLIEAEFLKEKP